MGRLSDFIDKETEKRNRRTDEKLQPFMQQMDLLIKTKEKQEVKEQTDTYYKSEFDKVGVTFDPTTPANTHADQLKRAMEERSKIDEAISTGAVNETDMKEMSHQEKLKHVTRNPLKTYTASKTRQLRVGDKMRTQKFNSETGVWDFDYDEPIKDTKTKTTKKESMQDKAEREGHGSYWDISKEIDPQRRYADAVKIGKAVIEKEKELEEYKSIKSINYAEPIAKDDAVKMGKSWLDQETKTSKKRLSDLNAGNPVEYKGGIYVKINDAVYKFNDSEEHSALRLATKFSKEYPEKIKQLEKEIEEMKGVGGEEMKSGKKKVIIKDTDTVTIKGVKYTLAEMGNMMKVVASVTDEEVETKFRTLME